MIFTNPEPLGRPVRPSADQPGTYEEQLRVVALSLYLAKRRGTTRRDEWQDARRMILPHAREGTSHE